MEGDDKLEEKIQSGTLDDLKRIYKEALTSEKVYNKIIELSKKKREALFGKEIKVFLPSKEFPSLSVTGKFCALKCKHCQAKYLQHMIDVHSPELLKSFCIQHEKNGGTGCLISGGYTLEGYVPLEPFIETIKWVKENTTLKVNIHTGLVTKKMATLLKYAKVDSVSVDISGDIKIIKEVYGLNKTPEDYLETLLNLKEVKVRITPHIGIGFYFGKITNHEFTSLDFVEKIEPPEVVFVIIIPTKGTPFEKIKPPSLREIMTYTALARIRLNSSISLGCMRPYGSIRKELDYLMLKYVADRIATPSPLAISKLIKEEYKIEEYRMCCTL
ncbi:MAG: radical SAM protein [Candidatus Asgardarchaeia archaeon]